MSKTEKYQLIAIVVCLITVAALVVGTLPDVLHSFEVTEPPQPGISSVTFSGSTIRIEGYSEQEQILVLRIGEAGQDAQEWINRMEFDSPFTAAIEYGNIVPMEDGSVGEGIVYQVSGKFSTATFNLGFSEENSLLSGTLRSRTEFAHPDVVKTSVTIADIVHEDGGTVPVTILLRPRDQD